MEFEGSTPIASVIDAPAAAQPPAPAPPLAPPQASRDADASPGSMIMGHEAAAAKKEAKKSTKIFAVDDETAMHIAALAAGAVVVLAMPAVRDRLMQYIPMLGNGDTASLVVNGALVGLAVYVALRFV